MDIGAATSGHTHAGDIPYTLYTAKGDILVGTGTSTVDNLPVGATDGMALMVDPAQSMGVRWATASTYIKEGANLWYAGFSDGDINKVAALAFAGTTTGSADQASTASFNRVRMSRFRLPRELALSEVHFFGGSVSSTGSLWKAAIYPVAGGAHIWSSSAFDSTGGDWFSVAASGTLTADTD